VRGPRALTTHFIPEGIYELTLLRLPISRQAGPPYPFAKLIVNSSDLGSQQLLRARSRRWKSDGIGSPLRSMLGLGNRGTAGKYEENMPDPITSLLGINGRDDHQQCASPPPLRDPEWEPRVIQSLHRPLKLHGMIGNIDVAGHEPSTKGNRLLGTATMLVGVPTRHCSVRRQRCTSLIQIQASGQQEHWASQRPRSCHSEPAGRPSLAHMHPPAQQQHRASHGRPSQR
jgi:hypothetical protein